MGGGEGAGGGLSKLVFYAQSTSAVISGQGLKLKSKCICWHSTAAVKNPPHTHAHKYILYRERELFEALAQVGERGERRWGESGGDHSRRHAVIPVTLTASGRFIAAVLTVIVAVTDPLHRDADAVAAGEEASWARAS